MVMLRGDSHLKVIEKMDGFPSRSEYKITIESKNPNRSKMSSAKTSVEKHLDKMLKKFPTIASMTVEKFLGEMEGEKINPGNQLQHKKIGNKI